MPPKPILVSSLLSRIVIYRVYERREQTAREILPRWFVLSMEDTMNGGIHRKLIAATIVLIWVLTGCQRSKEAISPLPFSSPLDRPVSPWPAGRVLYHSNLTGVYQIYLVDNGQPPVVLTHAPGSATEPSWSPNGQKIAFAAYITDATNIEIYTMRADGSERSRVMPIQSRLNWRPDWSPDGTQLLFQSNRDGNFEIYRVTVEGTSLVNITNHPANEGDPDWSPDGSKIVFISDRDGSNGLYTMAEDGSNVTNLLDGSWDCSFPRWSPDGRRIAFTSKRDGTLDIYVINADGSNVQRVTDRPGDNVMPAWVGNDQLIFSGEVGDLSWDLFLINVDGSGLVQLTRTPESERFPAWAP